MVEYDNSRTITHWSRRESDVHSPDLPQNKDYIDAPYLIGFTVVPAAVLWTEPLV